MKWYAKPRYPFHHGLNCSIPIKDRCFNISAFGTKSPKFYQQLYTIKLKPVFRDGSCRQYYLCVGPTTQMGINQAFFKEVPSVVWLREYNSVFAEAVSVAANKNILYANLYSSGSVHYSSIISAMVEVIKKELG